MQDVSFFLWGAAVIMLILQHYVKVPSILYLSELLGVGSLATTVNEIDAGALADNTGSVLLIMSVLVILFSTVNLIGYYWPDRRWTV